MHVYFATAIAHVSYVLVNNSHHLSKYYWFSGKVFWKSKKKYFILFITLNLVYWALITANHLYRWT
jgi:hypothetical protein